MNRVGYPSRAVFEIEFPKGLLSAKLTHCLLVNTTERRNDVHRCKDKRYDMTRLWQRQPWATSANGQLLSVLRMNWGKKAVTGGAHLLSGLGWGRKKHGIQVWQAGFLKADQEKENKTSIPSTEWRGLSLFSWQGSASKRACWSSRGLSYYPC